MNVTRLQPRHTRIIGRLAFHICLACIAGTSCADVRTAGQQISYAAPSQTLMETDTVEIKQGTWGGVGVSLSVEEKSATFGFDCAGGKIDAAFRRKKDGTFSVRGEYTRRGPGPIRLKNPPKAEPVYFEGSVSADRMKLTIRSLDTTEPFASFELSFEEDPSIRRCA